MRNDPQRLRFEIGARDGSARAGVIHTAHGPIETPAFIPLATKGTVRGLESAEVAGLGYQLILGNTYHLFVSPGPERIAAAGGLHGFMGWERALITDSGGFQVFSLAHGGVANEVKGSGRSGDHGSKVEISEEGARFRSPPRRRRAVHLARGLDERAGAARLRHRPRLRRVHALPRRPRLHRPLDRAHPPLARPLPRLARRARAPSARRSSGSSRAATHEDLRRESAQAVSEAGVDGIAIGGTLGRDKEEMAAVLAMTAPLLPEEAPKHLLGIGEVDDLLGGIALGLDVFDCAVPTRLARHGVALAPEPGDPLAPRPAQGRLGRQPRAAGRGLPLPGLPAPRPRLHQLPLPRRGADRRPPDRPPQPHLHARADHPRPQQRSRPAPSTATAPPSSPAHRPGAPD